jgi:hypothetical protein
LPGSAKNRVFSGGILIFEAGAGEGIRTLDSLLGKHGVSNPNMQAGLEEESICHNIESELYLLNDAADVAQLLEMCSYSTKGGLRAADFARGPLFYSERRSVIEIWAVLGSG